MTKTISDQTAPTRPEGLSITRNQPYVLYSFDCELCGKHHEIWRLPGAKPKYCPPEQGHDFSKCQKRANVLRVQKYRASKGRAK